MNHIEQTLHHIRTRILVLEGLETGLKTLLKEAPPEPVWYQADPASNEGAPIGQPPKPLTPALSPAPSNGEGGDKTVPASGRTRKSLKSEVSGLKSAAKRPARQPLNETRLREVLAALAEPFAPKQVAEAMAVQDPVWARKMTESGELGHQLCKLRDSGELLGQGGGRGRTYTRTAKFSTEPGLTEREREYCKLRAEIKTPASEE